MTLNPITLAVKGLYLPFKAAILATWRAARADAFAEIQAELAAETDAVAIEKALQEARHPEPAAIADGSTAVTEGPKPRKRQ